MSLFMCALYICEKEREHERVQKKARVEDLFRKRDRGVNDREREEK